MISALIGNHQVIKILVLVFALVMRMNQPLIKIQVFVVLIIPEAKLARQRTYRHAYITAMVPGEDSNTFKAIVITRFITRFGIESYFSTYEK